MARLGFKRHATAVPISINKLYLNVADFLKTSLKKFSVIWVEKRQKACFLKVTLHETICNNDFQRNRKGPFGDNVIKNPARKTLEYI